MLSIKPESAYKLRKSGLAELSEEMGLDADDLADLRDVLEMKLRVRCSW